MSIRSLFSSIARLSVISLGLAGSAALAASSSGEPFDPADREQLVECRRAIERVYAQNRSASVEADPVAPPVPSARLAMSDSELRSLAVEGLVASRALEVYWQAAIEPEDLQLELDRVAEETRSPERLAELFGVLDDDAERIAECLLRPIVAKERLRERFAVDRRPLGARWAAVDPETEPGAFDAWWHAARLDLEPVRPPRAVYRLPVVRAESEATSTGLGASLLADPPVGTWQATPTVPLDTEGSAVWTGSEMLFFGRFSTLLYSYDPALDRWSPRSTLDAPSARRDFTMVWTGMEAIVWGGCSPTNHACALGDGARYEPATDSWTRTAASPTVRVRHGAVWTGSEMLIWGGCRYSGDVCSVFPREVARYSPSNDTWTLGSAVDAPPGHNFVRAEWSGSEMLVWAGSSIGGGRYDPVADGWTPISTLDAPPGQLASVVWSGEELLAWGGCAGSPQCLADVVEGGRYDPSTNSWNPMAVAGSPSPRVQTSAVWTGDEMLVWGGADEDQFYGDGARYDPAKNSWTPMSGVGDPAPRRNQPTVWTGSEMILWGGVVPGTLDAARTGARYDPATDSWRDVSRSRPDSFRASHTAVWTGAEMLVWGGLGDGVVGPLATGRRFDPALAAWSPMAASGAPPASSKHTMVWTGTEAIVWGGSVSTRDEPGAGARYRPDLDQWTPTTLVGAPLARTEHAAVWTGSEMLVWGGRAGSSADPDAGGRYAPASDSWAPLSTLGAPEPRRQHGAVWTGDEMIVWGGLTPTGPIGNGGRYDPSSDTWSSISTVDAPEARASHSQIWTGDLMLVWGGVWSSPPPARITELGHRYDPASDSWSPIAIEPAPSPRFGHTGVWTGQELLVWGGCLSFTCIDLTATGGFYDPASDTWRDTSTSHAPEARAAHSAIWTGDEMIVWGGLTERNGYTNTGGIYSPGSLDRVFVDDFESGDMSAWSAVRFPRP